MKKGLKKNEQIVRKESGKRSENHAKIKTNHIKVCAGEILQTAELMGLSLIIDKESALCLIQAKLDTETQSTKQSTEGNELINTL